MPAPLPSSRTGEFGSRTGGLGVYGSNAAHGPFIHVDVRGSKARWRALLRERGGWLSRR